LLIVQFFGFSKNKHNIRGLMVLWVAFDMDSTLGYFESVSNFITLFAPWLLQEVYQAPYYKGPAFPVIGVSKDSRGKLFQAFRMFVKYVAADEKLNGLLRPGILPIIKRLLVAKKAGQVGGLMIYSNNSSRHMLIFVNELIKEVLGVQEEIFCPLVDWWHQIRDKECRSDTTANLGHGPKSVSTIQTAFTTAAMFEKCGYGVLTKKDVAAENIVFFDDLIHQDIYAGIPRANYFHVQPYVHYAPFNNLHKAFYKAYESVGLNGDKALLAEFSKIGFNFSSVGLVYYSIQARQPSGVDVDVNDAAVLLARLEALLTRKGGRRKTRRIVPKSRRVGPKSRRVGPKSRNAGR